MNEKEEQTMIIEHATARRDIYQSEIPLKNPDATHSKLSPTEIIIREGATLLNFGGTGWSIVTDQRQILPRTWQLSEDMITRTVDEVNKPLYTITDMIAGITSDDITKIWEGEL